MLDDELTEVTASIPPPDPLTVRVSLALKFGKTRRFGRISLNTFGGRAFAASDVP
ncbi:hypothetical protein [Actinopolyspora halophila]|uniref:hypothetical protein n=1 Tax=Actinopolyspora halophila TaxID=1850 RepID=UPI00036AD00F|nr:hypothetical protein [Actinopolyspora halophila]